MRKIQTTSILQAYLKIEEMPKTIYKKDLIYPELSYAIVGCAFDVFNELGGGHREKVYQKAMKLAFQNKLIAFKEQFYYPLKYKHDTMEKGFFDFLMEEKIIVELKSLGFFTKGNYDQVKYYMNDSGLKLALLITFGQNEVRSKRVVNFKAI